MLWVYTAMSWKPHAKIDDHGFLDCEAKQRGIHFNTEDIDAVAYCPFCGDLFL